MKEIVWLRPELVARWSWIAFIAILMLGAPVISAAMFGATHDTGDFLGMLKDRTLIQNMTLEVPLLGLLLLVLHRHGWHFADLRISPGLLPTAEGIGLLFATYLGLLTIGMILFAIQFLWPHSAFASTLLPKLNLHPHGGIHLSWIVLIVFVILNAFYEETIYMSFIFNQVAAKAGPNLALLVTVLVRLSLHSYQGISHVAQIGTWSLIFGLAYYWRGNVWPLLVAHIGIDLVSLGAMKILLS